MALGLPPVLCTADCVELCTHRLTRLVKIVKASLSMAVDEEFKDMSIDEMAEGGSGYEISSWVSVAAADGGMAGWC